MRGVSSCSITVRDEDTLRWRPRCAESGVRLQGWVVYSVRKSRGPEKRRVFACWPAPLSQGCSAGDGACIEPGLVSWLQRTRSPGPPTCPSWASISGCQHVAGAISGMDALECCAQPRLRRVQRAQQCGRRLHFGSRQRARERSTRSVLSCGQTTHRVGASVPWSIMM